MPAKSKSQQRLFGMVHAYQKGKLKHAPESVREIARSISDEDAEHFAKTKHKGLPEKKAYELGFMDKCAEYGMLKSAGMAGMTKFKDIRQWVNAIRRLRKKHLSLSEYDNTLNQYIRTEISPKLRWFDAPGAATISADEIAFSTKGFPKHLVYRGATLPDMSFGGLTSSNIVRKSGVNLRHISPESLSADNYGGGSLLMYNGKKVPGLFNGKLRFGTNRTVAGYTRKFTKPEGIFGPEDIRMGKARRAALVNTGSPQDYRGGGEFLDYESALDANKVRPSRVLTSGPSADRAEITNLYEYARRQRDMLPDGYNLHVGVRRQDGWFKGLTPAQAKAVERYAAIYDILQAIR